MCSTTPKTKAADPAVNGPAKNTLAVESGRGGGSSGGGGAGGHEAINNHVVTVINNRLTVPDAFADQAFRQWAQLSWAEPLPAAYKFSTMHPPALESRRMQRFALTKIILNTLRVCNDNQM